MNLFVVVLSLSFCFRSLRHKSHHRAVHLKALPQPKARPLVEGTTLENELREADKLDKMTLKELSIPITPEMLHSPNVPIYEPYKLTEAQQLVLLSHE